MVPVEVAEFGRCGLGRRLQQTPSWGLAVGPSETRSALPISEAAHLAGPWQAEYIFIPPGYLYTALQESLWDRP